MKLRWTQLAVFWAVFAVSAVIHLGSFFAGSLQMFRQFREPQHTQGNRQSPPLLVFLDINMPGKNGFEFLAEFAVLRETEPFASTVVMMFSSSARDEDRSTALGYDFVGGYLVKGQLDPNELLGTVQAAAARAPGA